MKRVLSLAVIAAVVFMSIPSMAGECKVSNGLKTIASSPLNVSNNVKEETGKGQFLPFAFVGGLLKGTFYMAKDITTGVVSIVTAPIDLATKGTCKTK